MEAKKLSYLQNGRPNYVCKIVSNVVGPTLTSSKLIGGNLIGWSNWWRCCLSHIVPGLLKRLNPFDYFILTLQISITCFGWRPDHMVFDSQLTKIYKDHKKLDPTFTFSHWQKVKAGKKWVLNFNPSGVSVLSHFPSPPLSSNPSLLKIILQFPLEQGRLLPTGIAWRSRPRGCCSWMVTTWD